MPLPEPTPGLVICYSYLWHNEHRAGVEEGRKSRPCAIVIAHQDLAGDTVVLVVPVTHTKPAPERHPVALSGPVRRRLGLDDQASWIVTDELNQFVWPGYDLRPVSRGTPDRFHYGVLPADIFAAVKRAVLRNARSGGARKVQR